MQTKKISDLPTLSVADKTLLIPCIDKLATSTATVTAEAVAALGGGTPALNSVNTEHLKAGAVLANNVQFQAGDRIIVRPSTGPGNGEEVACTQFGRDWLALQSAGDAALQLNLNLFSNPVFTGQMSADSINANSISAASITGDNTIVRTNDPALALKAWVNFDGFNGNIRAQHNVPSITRVGVGNYQVNFGTPFPDLNYAVLITLGGTFDVQITRTGAPSLTGEFRTTSNFRFIAGRRSNGAYADASYIHVAVFR